MNTDIAVRNRLNRFLWGSCLLAALLFGAAARAQESPLLDYVDQKILDVGAQLQNAKVRLRLTNGAVEPRAEGQETGVGWTCCEHNLSTIGEKLQLIRASIERIAAYYVEEENGQALGILGQMEARLRQIGVGSVAFARAPDEADARGALAGLIRPWNEFRNGVKELRRCCPIPLAVETEAGGEGAAAEDEKQGKATKNKDKKSKKKKSKKDKKKQDVDDPVDDSGS